MDIVETEKELRRLHNLVSLGRFDEALQGVEILYVESTGANKGAVGFYAILSNIASIYIDIGHMMPCDQASSRGLSVLEKYKDEIISIIGEDAYYYNLGNAKSNLVSEKNPFKHSFATIEELVKVKNDLWKANRAFENFNLGEVEPTYQVNLANCLKQQFRIVEALDCYNYVNELNLDIPQAWINKSETLMMLNQVSNSYSIQMLSQIKTGYENVLKSQRIPPPWIEYYRRLADDAQKKLEECIEHLGVEMDVHDSDLTQSEYEQLSDYRKFCLDNNLGLSEHGLYCSCMGSSRDNLTIPTSGGVVGDFVVPMEMVLNRLKSEFSFARHLYYDYQTGNQDYELLHDSCFSELFNDEILGLDVEKLRAAFRSCFGILDKIGIAICELFDVYPKNGKVYFQSFWQLDQGERREIFNAIKNPGLLALYSIATDLNERKDGEWSFLKDLRNCLEHQFLVVHKNDVHGDVYDSYDFMKDIRFVKEDEFISNLKRLLQLTRSAIFSFVFAVRDKAICDKRDDVVYFPNRILRQNFKDD